MASRTAAVMLTTSVGRMATLADELRSWPDERLVALLRARPDLVTPVPPDLRTLAARAGTVPSVARVLDRVDEFTLQVADVLCVASEPTSDDEVRRLLGADPAPALQVLREAAVVWGEEALQTASGLRSVLPFPAGLGPPLDALPAMPALLARTLRDPQRLDALIAEVSPVAREVLTRLAQGPPTGSVGNADRRVEPAAARTPVEELLARGLLVPVDRVTVVLPREVGLHLRGGRVHPEVLPEPPQLALRPGSAADVDAVAAGAAFTAVRQIEELLETWSLDGPPALKSGGLGVRELRRAAALLDVEEPVAALLVEVTYAAGLVAPSGELEETWLPSPAYDAWRAQGTARRWVDLVEAWRATTRVPGLAGRRDERDKVLAALGPGLDRSVAPELRAGVLRELATLPPGTAADEESLAARLHWRRPRQGGELRAALVGWSVSEAELLGVTGRGALTRPTRALLDGGRDSAAERLAPLLPRPLDFVLLQADLTAVAPGPLTSELAGELGLMAEVESRGAATVYRFRDSSVRRALDAGRTAADLHAFLAAASRTPVPQPLTYLIDDLARRHGRIRVGTASAYVRCDDESVLSELLAHRRAASLGLRRLAPTVLAAEVPAEVLLDRLRSLGYAPAAESPDGAVLVRRPDARRSPARPRPARLAAELPAPGDALLTAAVRALRAGGRSGGASTGGDGPAVPLRRAGPYEVLSALRTAAAEGRPVWIGYVNAEGRATLRMIEPLQVEGGYVSAFDHLRDEVRTFSVSRITGIAEVEAGVEA